MEEGQSSKRVYAMSLQRLQDSMERLHYSYFTSKNGSLCTIWHPFIIYLYPPEDNYPLQVRSTWYKAGCVSHAKDFKHISQIININSIEAKTFVTTDDNGISNFKAEVVLNTIAGVSDLQLDNFIKNAINSILNIFTIVENHFSDPMYSENGDTDNEY